MHLWLKNWFKGSVKVTTPATRLKKQTRYKSFRMSKPLKSQTPKLLSAPQLINQSLSFMAQYKWRFSFHGLIFSGLYGLLVYGFGQQLDLPKLKTDIAASSGAGLAGHLNSGLRLLAELFEGGTQVVSQQSGLYSFSLLLIMSLATIWLIRALRDKPKQLKTRDAYYFGPSQLVPFILSLLVIAIQLLPMFIANQVAGSLQANDVLLTGAEQALVVTVVLLFNVLSLYLLVGSIFSLIIVSLPGARPWQAVQSSFNITRYRRHLVVLHLLALLVIGLIVTIIFMLPFLILATAIAEYAFYLLYVFLFMFAHVYLYGLYRELIK